MVNGNIKTKIEIDIYIVITDHEFYLKINISVVRQALIFTLKQ